MKAPTYYANYFADSSTLNSALAQMAAGGYVLHSMAAGGGEEGCVWVVMVKPAPAGAGATAELQAWREACHPQRLEALDYLARNFPRMGDEYADQPAQRAEKLADDLRALAAGETGKGGAA